MTQYWGKNYPTGFDLHLKYQSEHFLPYREELAVGDDADEADAVGVAVEGRGGDAVDLAEASEEEGKTNGRHLEIFALKIMNKNLT